jgi:hypothetical protein
MLKNKLKNLEKTINKMAKSKTTGVFFVGIQEGKYIVKAGGDKVVFQGDKEGYRSFANRYDEGSVFIVDDIPREVTGTNIFDWID